MSVHDGHRERMKSSFKKNGLDSMNDVNALELLLFYAIPRRDTNVIAHTLLDHFGSLSRVFSASIQELCAVEGVGENTAVLISMIPQLVRKSMVSDAEKITVIKNSKDAGKYLVPRFAFEQDEVALLVCLDSQKRVIGCFELGRGVVNKVSVDVRKVVELALRYKASSVILSHNHPDSFALPSLADTAMTEQIYRSLRLVGITLADHIIVSGEDYVSYLDSGMLVGIR